MEKGKPDQIVYNEELGYHANILPYGTNVGGPVIRVDDVVSWKSRGVENVNKEFASKFQEIRQQYESLMQEFEWNELIYNAKFSFEPVIGEVYHLYRGSDGSNFLSLIAPYEWNREHLGTFQLNSNRKWVFMQ